MRIKIALALVTSLVLSGFGVAANAQMATVITGGSSSAALSSLPPVRFSSLVGPSINVAGSSGLDILSQPAVVGGTAILGAPIAQPLPAATVLINDGCNQAIVLPGATGVPSLLPNVATQAAVVEQPAVQQPTTTTTTRTVTTKKVYRQVRRYKRSCRRVIRRKSCARVRRGCN